MSTFNLLQLPPKFVWFQTGPLWAEVLSVAVPITQGPG